LNSFRIMVIGLDGVSWDLLDPMIKKGLMPFVSELRRTGSWGYLRSTDPPSTAPAWSTFMTGKNPGKHGIFDLTLLRGHTIEEIPVSTTRMIGHRMWDILSKTGKRSIIINMPVTWPPSPLNGIIISDFLTPKSEKIISWPPEIRKEIEDRFGPFRLYFNRVYTPRGVGAVIEEAMENLEYRWKTARYLFEKKEWDLGFVHCFGTDRIQHELFHMLDPGHPNHREKETDRYLPLFEKYFSEVDNMCRDLHSVAAENNAGFIIMSDHGMGPVKDFLVFNIWLMNEGYLVLRNSLHIAVKKILFNLGITPGTSYRIASLLGLSNLRQSTGIGTRYRLLNLLNKIFLGLDDVDWSRTRAYSKGNYGQIYLNVKGRQPYGIVERGDEYEELRNEIKKGLLRLGENDENPVRLDVKFGEDVYNGPFVEQAPDIYLLPVDMSHKALGTMDFITKRFIVRNFAQSGDHRMFGILSAVGEPFKQNYRIEGAGIVDLAPTILHLLDVPVPSDMDGRVLTGMLLPGFDDADSVKTGPPTGEILPEDADFSGDDIKEIRSRLTGMGYIG